MAYRLLPRALWRIDCYLGPCRLIRVCRLIREPALTPEGVCGSVAGADKLVAPPVTFGDFQKTLSTCKASVGPEQLEEFEKFTRSFGQDG